MSTGNQQSTHPSPTNDPGELARRQQEQAQADADEQRQRSEQARVDDAQLAAAQADAAAQAAQSTADGRRKIAEQLAAEAEGDQLEEIDFGQRTHTVRTFGGGVRKYGPGKARVPRSVADAIRNAPTFATSGDRVADAAVRRRLERDHGITELVSTEDSTARAAFGGDEHTNAGEDNDEVDGGGRAITDNVGNQPPIGGSVGGNRAETRRGRNKPDAEPMSKSALKGLGADEVERRYNEGVRAGRVKAVKDGKGSGADGAVVTDDRVDALVEAGETE